MFYQKGAVIAHRLGFNVALDEFPKSGSTVVVGAAPPRLGTPKKSKLHGVSSFDVEILTK
jgi:hypothetical protein